jgi:hypothetical protein
MGRYDPAATVISELRTFGIEPAEVKQTGRGHHKIYFNLNGKRRFIVCAATPSDHRAEQNNRSVVRRIINQENTQL